MGSACIENGSFIADSRKENLYIHAAPCSIRKGLEGLLVRDKVGIGQVNEIFGVNEGGHVHDIGDPVLLARGAANDLDEIVSFSFQGREIFSSWKAPVLFVSPRCLRKAFGTLLLLAPRLGRGCHARPLQYFFQDVHPKGYCSNKSG